LIILTLIRKKCMHTTINNKNNHLNSDDYKIRMEICLYMHNILILHAEKRTTGQLVLHYKNGHILKYDETIKRNIRIEP